MNTTTPHVPTTTTPRRKASPTVPIAHLNETDAARYSGYSPSYLRHARSKGEGPAYLRIGRSVRYRIVDLDAWADEHRVEPCKA